MRPPTTTTLRAAPVAAAVVVLLTLAAPGAGGASTGPTGPSELAPPVQVSFACGADQSCPIPEGGSSGHDGESDPFWDLAAECRAAGGTLGSSLDGEGAECHRDQSGPF